MINRNHDLPLLQQCKALKIHRTTIYREPRPVNQWSAPIWYTSGYIRDPASIVAYSVGAL